MKNLLARGGAVAIVCAILGGFGCLTRPVTNHPPSTKDEHTEFLKQQAVDKVDLLFMIDNSASMGDKQDLLALAVPDLVSRLLTPNCVLKTDKDTIVARRADGTCPDNAKAEFEPVHDMHLGVVSSAMGGGGGDLCAPETKVSANQAPNCTNVNAHNDDKGHLLDRTKPDCTMPNGVEGSVPDATPGNYLAWLPDVDKNMGKPTPAGGVPAIKDPSCLTSQTCQLNIDFKSLVQGAQEYGCGL